MSLHLTRGYVQVTWCVCYVVWNWQLRVVFPSECSLIYLHMSQHKKDCNWLPYASQVCAALVWEFQLLQIDRQNTVNWSHPWTERQGCVMWVYLHTWPWVQEIAVETFDLFTSTGESMAVSNIIMWYKALTNSRAEPAELLVHRSLDGRYFIGGFSWEERLVLFSSHQYVSRLPSSFAM